MLLFLYQMLVQCLLLRQVGGIHTGFKKMEMEERKKVVDDQNKLLDQLHNSVLNTRQYALKIGDELTEHDKMLDALHRGVEDASGETQRQQKSVVQLLKDSKNGGFYSIVAILVVVIVVLLMV